MEYAINFLMEEYNITEEEAIAIINKIDDEISDGVVVN